MPLSESDQGWKAQVEKLKENDPLLTKVRTLLNKISEDTLQIFTEDLVKVLTNSYSRNRVVFNQVVEQCVGTIFKKASGEKCFAKLYAQLLQGVLSEVWQRRVFEAVQKQIELECDKLFQDLGSDRAMDRKFYHVGSSKFLAFLRNECIISERVVVRVLNGVVAQLDELEGLKKRELGLEIATCCLQNLKRRKLKASNTQRYLTHFKEIKESFTFRGKFMIMDVLETYQSTRV